MAVTKIIELVGSSPTSSDEAVQAALSEAQSSLRNIKAVDVVSTGLRGDNLDELYVTSMDRLMMLSLASGLLWLFRNVFSCSRSRNRISRLFGGAGARRCASAAAF